MFHPLISGGVHVVEFSLFSQYSSLLSNPRFHSVAKADRLKASGFNLEIDIKVFKMPTDIEGRPASVQVLTEKIRL